jgi:transposase
MYCGKNLFLEDSLMLYVGMDVHVRNSYLTAMNEKGQVIKKGRIRNDGDSLAGFLDDLGADSMRVCLESTTTSRPIYGFLETYGREAGIDLTAEVLDARRLRIIAESTCKCDRVDAAVICELARSNLKLPVCYMPDDEVFALREHLRSRHDLVRMRTMLKNRVHAVLHRRGILPPEQGLFTQVGRGFLAQTPLDAAGREILDRLLDLIGRIDQAVRESTASVKELSRTDRWREPAERLETMPGIGLITAMTILAELGDWSRFKSRAAVSNYAGLVPVVRDSNEKQYRGGISHRGSNHLRSVLTEAAWVAMKRVPKYQGLFARVRYKRNPAVAVIAVAREMLEDTFTLLRKKENFKYVPASGPWPLETDSRRDREVALSAAG